MTAATYKVKDPSGLHARPSALLVKTVQEFKDCSFSMQPSHLTEDCKLGTGQGMTFGLMALLMVAIPTETEIKVQVSSSKPERELALLGKLDNLTFWDKIN